MGYSSVRYLNVINTPQGSSTQTKSLIISHGSLNYIAITVISLLGWSILYECNEIYLPKSYYVLSFFNIKSSYNGLTINDVSNDHRSKASDVCT